jgi:hypothetical protein
MVLQKIRNFSIRFIESITELDGKRLRTLSIIVNAKKLGYRLRRSGIYPRKEKSLPTSKSQKKLKKSMKELDFNLKQSKIDYSYYSNLY